MKVEMNIQGVARYDERCWAHITDCDRLCETNSSHGADFHACDQPAIDDLGLCERHRKEILGEFLRPGPAPDRGRTGTMVRRSRTRSAA
jgi:hypothetical protein